MAKAFKTSLQGLSKFKDKLRKAPKELQEEIGFELLDGVNRMVQGAKKDAPGNHGILRAEISSLKVAALEVDYISGALYSGYVEFGTRSLVSIPAGLEEYAAQVKAQKNASSLKAKEAIFQWCKDKGIAPELWYPIFIKIMTKGIKPHPFFFKQVEKQEPSIKKVITEILKEFD